MHLVPTLPADLSCGVALSGLPPDILIAWCHRSLVWYEKPQPNQFVIDLVTLAMRMTVVMGNQIRPENTEAIFAVKLTPLHLTGSFSLIARFMLKCPEIARDFFDRYLPVDEKSYDACERAWGDNHADGEAGRAVISFHVAREMHRIASFVKLHHLLAVNP